GFDFFPAWSVSTACGATSGTAALYYGLDAGLMTPGCSYLMNFMGFTMPSSGTAHSPVITLPPDQGYHATMKLMASISAAPAVDSFTISVKPAGGAPVVLLTKADITTGASWKDVSLDLGPWAGQQIQLSFFFDDLGNTTPGGTGVLVDDLSFTADCNPD
ncbi:MAG: hypothetical protein FJ098_09730, partial [Deltaproteobacteria bacterium]|nr:hypothetical protein [Deltaproteobacteria bacterium]